MYKDYYAILDIPISASQEEIKKAYLKMAMRFHPDRNAGFQEEAEKKMKLVNEAQGILSNIEKRRIYDLYEYQKPTRERKENKSEPKKYSSSSNQKDETKTKSKNAHFTIWEILKHIYSKIYFYFLKLPYFFRFWIIIFLLSGVSSLFSAVFDSSEEWYVPPISTNSGINKIILDNSPSNKEEVSLNTEIKSFNQENLVSNNYELNYPEENISRNSNDIGWREVMQDAKFRVSPGISEVIRPVIRGEKIWLIDKKQVGKNLWYSTEIDGKRGWISYIAFVDDPSKPSASDCDPINGKIDEKGYCSCKEGLKWSRESRACIYQKIIVSGEMEKGQFDCGEGGMYFDSIKSCFCNPGYGKGNNGKCEAIDCGVGGTYFDSINSCYCNPGYGKDNNGKCIK